MLRALHLIRLNSLGERMIAVNAQVNQRAEELWLAVDLAGQDVNIGAVGHVERVDGDVAAHAPILPSEQ